MQPAALNGQETPAALANAPGAVLIAEIGSVMTRVTLVDAVDGETRLIGQAEVTSTADAPYEAPAEAILQAAGLIADATGRELRAGAGLLMPQNAERDGVNSILVITSAAGSMALVVAAVSSDVSGRSALHAARSTYTTVLQVITLNEAGDTERTLDDSWIERQVQILLGLRPDAVLLAGGLEQGAEDALVRLAHIVALTTPATQAEHSGQGQDITLRPVIFAGNSHARERVIDALSGHAAPVVTANVRPSLDVEHLEPTRRELHRMYYERVLPQMTGIAALRRMSTTPVRIVCEAQGLMTRFVAERYQRDALTVDIGASNTSAFLASRGRYSPAVLGSVGSGFGLGAVLASRGLASIARWLPYVLDDEELKHRLLNKLLRPHVLPVSREDLLLEHAVAREALGMALAALWDERPDATYDLVLACGGVLAHAPHPGLAALTLLDALQPGAGESGLAVTLQLDTLGLLAASGALAFSDADGAVTLFERDMLRNTPLATCVATLGNGRSGDPAIEAELQIVGGAHERLTVAFGQIGRLPLPPGRKARLVLRPAGGVRIGRNPSGAEVATEVAAIGGSALGVVIDARGRPLRLPEENGARQRALWDWLTALGVADEPLPYPIVERRRRGSSPSDARISSGPTEQGAASLAATPSAERWSSATVPQPAPQGGPDDDLAKLRRTVSEEPKKRRLFGRK